MLLVTPNGSSATLPPPHHHRASPSPLTTPTRLPMGHMSRWYSSWLLHCTHLQHISYHQAWQQKLLTVVASWRRHSSTGSYWRRNTRQSWGMTIRHNLHKRIYGYWGQWDRGDIVAPTWVQHCATDVTSCRRIRQKRIWWDHHAHQHSTTSLRTNNGIIIIKLGVNR